jgi:hypothetical protein
VGADAQAAASIAPTVTTAAIADVTTTTATGGGNVTDDGGAAVTERGICYNTTGTPTTASTKVTSGTGEGAFTAPITGLTHSTAYYLRAYAINSVGTSYGAEISFFTRIEAAPIYVPPTTTPTIPSRNGVNLDKLESTGVSIFYKNVGKQVSVDSSAPHGWVSVEEVGGAETNVDITSDADTGMPLEIPFDNGSDAPQYATTDVLNVEAGSYPAGVYTIKLRGTGTVVLTGDASGTFSHNGVGTMTSTFTVTTPSSTGIHITITVSNVADPLQPIEIILPGYSDTYESSPFYPPMVEFCSQFDAVLRFMDPLRTNGQFQLVNWEDRITEDYYTNAGSKGMCYEDMIALCNAARCNLWVCVPHLASDEFVSELFSLIGSTLASGFLVYVEYCNEAWNSGFTHYNQINALGQALWPLETAASAGRRYYAKRAAEIFQLAEEAMGSRNGDVVKILSGQASQTSVVQAIIDAFNVTDLDGVEVNPNGVAFHAIAIAPYLGAATGGSGTNWADTTYTNGYTTVAQVLALGAGSMLTSVLTRVAAHKVIADVEGVSLIAYECGANAVSTQHQSDSTLNTLMNATMRDQGMYALYQSYIDGCRTAGMTLMAHYSYFQGITNANKYGLLESMDQSLTTAWRYRSWRGIPETGGSTNLLHRAPPIFRARHTRRLPIRRKR